MNKRRMAILLIPFFVVGCSWLRGDTSLSYDEIQGDYVQLFNGETLEGWVVMGNPSGWQVVNGVIRSEGGQGGNWLRSEREYRDFVLELECRISAGANSGVFFRCSEQGNPWDTGYECQISTEQPPRDALHCTGSLYGLVAAETRPSETPDVWRQYRILCKNNRIMIFVDGINTVDVDVNKEETLKGKPMAGFIGLQDAHGEEGTWVEFRNIRIREW